jgi:hypothetical protein
MKIAFYIILAFIVLPFALFFSRLFLDWAFSCSGMDHVEQCAVPGGRAIVSVLVGLTWVSAPAVPLGLLALGILGIVWLRGFARNGRL